ncbi:hypothetical protein H920_18514 [Fukomys damarensis]|uniref:Uncharacterized protein n=1 Tax=Fukomys damarensis TaxID=885580 RepID=A0A091CRT2_FUKDA|nr:hypothetical protein H920_18514 [Fukomys damarensis]
MTSTGMGRGLRAWRGPARRDLRELRYAPDRQTLETKTSEEAFVRYVTRIRKRVPGPQRPREEPGAASCRERRAAFREDPLLGAARATEDHECSSCVRPL